MYKITLQPWETHEEADVKILEKSTHFHIICITFWLILVLIMVWLQRVINVSPNESKLKSVEVLPKLIKVIKP
ncbi:unnamed protein product [Oppiella nova]|uniref:Uncharacterized protein n=1 Tax=Oppiella nova TaxID=334625 RepID=A0A7R9QRE6_9ACAR|nr:unnamed protein product [Oppiella nova]CAG2171143.1 unnamed protein product [Oppiella nova]